MTDIERDKIAALGSIAYQASALSHYLSEALSNDPQTNLAGQAIEGIETMLEKLGADLLAIADPNS